MLGSLPENKGSKAEIINSIQDQYGITLEKQSKYYAQIGQTLSKSYTALENKIKLIAKKPDCSLHANASLKDMIVISLKQLGCDSSIDEILEQMISTFGKQKVCQVTNQMLLSYNDHSNQLAVKCIKQKIQKVVSKHKDTLFRV